MLENSAPTHRNGKFRERSGAGDAEAMSESTLPVSSSWRGGRGKGLAFAFRIQSLDPMFTELAPTVAEDSAPPLSAGPADVRQWGTRVRVAECSVRRVTVMLVETAVVYVGFVVLGQTIDRWY